MLSLLLLCGSGHEATCWVDLVTHELSLKCAYRYYVIFYVIVINAFYKTAFMQLKCKCSNSLDHSYNTFMDSDINMTTRSVT